MWSKNLLWSKEIREKQKRAARSAARDSWMAAFSDGWVGGACVRRQCSYDRHRYSRGYHQCSAC